MIASFSIATATLPSHTHFPSIPKTLPPSTISPFPRKFTRRNPLGLSIRVQTLDFTGTFFERGLDGDDDDDDDDDEDSPGFTGPLIPEIEDKEEIPCPPGLRQYETMIVLIPDLSEEERLAVTQKYEELLVAGGGMYVEIFNRGVIPLAFSIQKVNRAGETNTYMDGIYILYTYFTKPESLQELEETLKFDYAVIRRSTFKIRKRKY